MRRSIVLGAAVAAFAMNASGNAATSERSAPGRGGSAVPASDSHSIAPRFVENAGQWGGDVAFVAAGKDRTLVFGPESMTLAQGGAAVEYAFDGTRGAIPRGESQARAKYHYFRGSAKARHARTFSSVVYDDAWPGVDVRFDARPAAVEYSFVVRPGADASAARIRVSGATRVATTTAGALAVTTGADTVTHSRPVAWQEKDGVREPVAVAFDVGPRGDDGSWTYGFALGAHDRTRAVVIDPEFDVEAIETGLVSGDYVEAVALDAQGRVYAVGRTGWSGAVPAGKAGFDVTLAGGIDAWLGKFDTDGQLLWATFLGGVGAGWDEDTATGVGVDDEGRPVVFGRTRSSDFPTTLAPLTSSTTGAWLARLTADGSSLVHSRILGGTEGALAVGADGAAYVGWYGASSTLPVTTTIGPGSHSAFGVAAKFSKTGAALWVTDLRRTSATQAGYTTYIVGAAVDADGALHLTGTAYGVDSLPPATATNSYGGGVEDAFAIKVHPDGTSLDHALYVGGSSYDNGAAIAVDAQGAAYVVASTQSSIQTFQGYDPARGGTANNVLARIPASGTSVAAVLPLGGPCGGGCIDQYGIAFDAQGRVLVNVEWVYRCPSDLSTKERLDTISFGGAPQIGPSGEIWCPSYEQIDRFAEKAPPPPPVDPVPASVPESVAVLPSSPNSVRITWRGAGNESSFLVERSSNGGEFVSIGSLPGTVTQFDDVSVTPDAEYSYRVIAITPTEWSDPSAAVTLRMPASIRVRVRRAGVRDRVAADADSVGLGASIRFLTGGSRPGFDPSAHDLRLAIGDVFVLNVPARHSGWTVDGGVPVWRGPVGPAGTARLVVDFAHRRLVLKATGLDLDAALTRSVLVSLRIGDDAGSQSLAWRAAHRASFRK